MSNIWEFLLQTMEVTLTAMIILLLKWMFQDKLSPRWQYGIWTLLAVKLILPAGLFRSYVSLDLAAALQVLKTKTECRMESQFSDAFMAIQPNAGIPTSIVIPQSITDWLFAIYLAGVIAAATYYIIGYFRLQFILRKGLEPADETCQKVMRLCETYSLKPCRIRILDGIESAFICGFFRPVLVIPSNQEDDIDDKILLHELLHKKYFDLWQNGFWCLMRCVHWCNPAMQYVFNRIGNDMESLCDQRVLERIEGEERRDYGRILLSMTNSKYARALGTTSLSNGGSNIKRRIESIVRFKKYPKGMALVSLCICLLIAAPVFGGTRQGVDFHEDFSWVSSQDVALAKIHLQGCSTAAGAIDCYTKGILQGHEAYLAAALPAEQQQKAKEIAAGSPLRPEWENYFVMNLEATDSGEMYPYVVLCSEHSEYDEYGEYEDEPPYKVLALPLIVKQENHRWVAASAGEPIQYRDEGWTYGNYQENLPSLNTYHGKCEAGNITLEEQTYHYIMSKKEGNEWDWFGYDSTNLSQEPDPDAGFSRHELHYVVNYEHDMNNPKWQNVESVALSSRVLTDDEPNPNWSEDVYTRMTSGQSASGDGTAVMSERIEDIWRGDLQMDIGFFEHDKGLKEAKGYAVRVYINKLPQDTIFLERGDMHEQ